MITVLSLSPAVDKVYFVDNFEAGGLYRVGNVVKSAGGKGLNVSRVASILGEKVRVLGFKAGESGDWLEAQMKAGGVETHFISVKGESRTNNNIIDRTRNIETEVLETGPFIPEDKKKVFFERLKDVLNSTQVLVCSGGLPEGIPAGFYRTVIEVANASGVKVILDTSNEVLEESIKACPYIIKPNLRELSRLVNRQIKELEEVVEACRTINSRGIGIVAASLGSMGAVLCSSDTVLYAKVPKIAAVNTIGSGDSMVAGLAVSVTRGYSLEKMLRLGMACAVENASHVEVGVIDAQKSQKLFNEIEIERLA